LRRVEAEKVRRKEGWGQRSEIRGQRSGVEGRKEVEKSRNWEG